MYARQPSSVRNHSSISSNVRGYSAPSPGVSLVFSIAQSYHFLQRASKGYPFTPKTTACPEIRQGVRSRMWRISDLLNRGLARRSGSFLRNPGLSHLSGSLCRLTFLFSSSALLFSGRTEKRIALPPDLGEEVERFPGNSQFENKRPGMPDDPSRQGKESPSDGAEYSGWGNLDKKSGGS